MEEEDKTKLERIISSFPNLDSDPKYEGVRDSASYTRAERIAEKELFAHTNTEGFPKVEMSLGSARELGYVIGRAKMYGKERLIYLTGRVNLDSSSLKYSMVLIEVDKLTGIEILS